MISPIAPHLLERFAAIYIRQSDRTQVIHNQGSTARQHDLVHEALRLGWASEKVLVFHDPGRSASKQDNRPHFDRLLHLIDHGKIGIVIVVDGTRASRNRVEWAKLLEACRYSGTLLSINGGTYDPNNEAHMRRLDQIQSRSVTGSQLITKKMMRARHVKVSQGNMRFKLPVGYEYDTDGKVVKSHDGSVRAAIEQLFQLFQDLGSAYGVVKELRRRNVKVPRAGRRRGEPVRWVLPTRPMLYRLLDNPAYAGASAYYRTQTFQIRPGSDVPRPPRRLHNPDEWRVLRQGAHKGYITWGQYLANRKQLRANQAGGAEAHPRKGPALLQGLMRCGYCGRHMVGEFANKRRGECKYSCPAKREIADGRGCQTVIGDPIEQVVIGVVLEALSPAQTLVVERAEAERLRRAQEALRQHAQQTEALMQRVKEAEATFTSGIQARLDPVYLNAFAQTWEAALNHLEAHRAAAPPPLPERMGDVGQAVRDLRQLWDDPTLDNAQRKYILRSVVTDVEVVKDASARTVLVLIRWQGGSHTAITLGDEQYRFQRPTPEAVLDTIRELAPQMQPRRIAERLNAQGWQTSQGLQFSGQKVVDLMQANDIPRHPFVRGSDVVKSDFPADHYTVKRLVSRLGIPASAVAAYFPIVTLGVGQSTQRLKPFIHVPKAAFRAIRPLVGEIRRSYLVPEDVARFAAQRLTDAQWAVVKQAVGAEMANPKSRLAVDALLWMTRHDRTWEGLPLAHQVQIRRLVTEWNRQEQLPSLFHALEKALGLPNLAQLPDVAFETGGRDVGPIDDVVRDELHRVLSGYTVTPS